MQIQTLQQPNFKATYPVVHWVAETNGSFAPVANLDTIKKLQGKLVRALNKTKNDKTPTAKIAKPIQNYIRTKDADYNKVPRVRSFYNRVAKYDQAFEPASYIISGADVKDFEETLAKNIGREKSRAKEFLNFPYSYETLQALHLYNNNGLAYVKNDAKQIKDENGIPQILHTKFEVVRNKLGKVTDFKLLDIRFLPAKGDKNPLERLNK